jgi:hypothetical protein
MTEHARESDPTLVVLALSDSYPTRIECATLCCVSRSDVTHVENTQVERPNDPMLRPNKGT